MITIKYYLENKHNFIDSETIDSEISDIDDARLALIRHLGKHYSDCKYKMGLHTPHDKSKEKTINVIFEKSAFVKRDLLIKKLLGND